MPQSSDYQLNLRADAICREMVDRADALKIVVTDDGEGVPLIDCGAEAPGSIAAGLQLARVTTAGLAEIDLSRGDHDLWPGPWVTIRTDWPVQACLAAQYAGWEIKEKGFFAMGSGPMRALAGREALFDRIGCRESDNLAVGVLESGTPPPLEVAVQVAAKCDVGSRRLTLLYAPTSSLAGTIQVVARSVETALHKLDELGFDVCKVESGFGSAPLPPVSADDLVGIGRTNDAILYASHVTLWLRGEDDHLRELATQLPAASSADFGQPFLEIMKRYDHDF